ncbi:MAG: sigma-70 family RNA polymerase sigma factor [Bdellovibrionales bacterium]|nr:sigma-70 family RNA polymerase sigma factor [Bdellovibrionales bacterium]
MALARQELLDVRWSSPSRKVGGSKQKQSLNRGPELGVRLDLAQQEALILEHRRIGRKMAQSMLNRWNARLEKDDFCSVVDLALCVAAQRFDPDRGVQFTTFLYYYLKGELVSMIYKASAEPVASQDNLAHLIDTHECKFSLEEHSSNCFDSSKESQGSPLEEFLRKELAEILSDPLRSLRSLERQIVTGSLILDKPIDDLARELGITRSHVSRTKKKALTKLAKLLDPYKEELLAA